MSFTFCEWSLSATNTAFSANRNVFYLMGQHAHGNGGVGGGEL